MGNVVQKTLALDMDWVDALLAAFGFVCSLFFIVFGIRNLLWGTFKPPHISWESYWAVAMLLWLLADGKVRQLVRRHRAISLAFGCWFLEGVVRIGIHLAHLPVDTQAIVARFSSVLGLSGFAVLLVYIPFWVRDKIRCV